MDAFNFIFENDILETLDSLDRIVRRPRIFKQRRDYFEEYYDFDFCTRFRLSYYVVFRWNGLIKDSLRLITYSLIKQTQN